MQLVPVAVELKAIERMRIIQYVFTVRRKRDIKSKRVEEFLIKD